MRTEPAIGTEFGYRFRAFAAFHAEYASEGSTGRTLPRCVSTIGVTTVAQFVVHTRVRSRADGARRGLHLALAESASVPGFPMGSSAELRPQLHVRLLRRLYAIQPAKAGLFTESSGMLASADPALLRGWVHQRVRVAAPDR